jgi:MFS family permease
VRRVRLIVAGAGFQALTVAALVYLGLGLSALAVPILIVTAMLYQVGGNIVQPQWRAVMVTLVPVRRRGRYFGRRSRLTAVTSFGALAGGGVLLHVTDLLDRTAWGFALLFLCALVGRIVSVRLLAGLPDPQEVAPSRTPRAMLTALGDARRALAQPDFRHFTFFVAYMHGAVAVAGPFLSVHMLRNLGFSYVEFMANIAGSIVVQLLTLSSWGYISDRLGNRIILVTTAFIIPIVPILWIFSDNFWYLFMSQCLAGLAWGGFSLSSSNYLYDLRPAGSELANFAAVQAVVIGMAVFGGATLGGILATDLPLTVHLGGVTLTFASTLYGVFAISGAMRLGVALWFTPHVAEIRLSRNATVNEMIYRFARFNPITGVMMDIIGAVRRPGRSQPPP